MAIHVLNVRQSLSGGGVADRVRSLPLPFQLTSPRLLILIHGYNDGLMDARAAYATFLQPGLDPLGTHDLPPYAWMAYLDMLEGDTLDRFSTFGEVCLLFWPGDLWGRGVSALGYVPEIRLARDSALRMARFLETLAAGGIPGGGPLEVALICHSLGNRLGLELINSVGRDDRIKFTTMCLMAAAVPVPMVTPGGLTHDLTPAVGLIGRTLVLYSESDSVLSLGFPPFETFAGEGTNPEAVGHRGNPAAGLWTQRMRMAGYGHGDYWAGYASGAANSSRDEVLRFLGEPLPNRLSRSTIAERRGPQAARLAGRRLASNQILTAAARG